MKSLGAMKNEVDQAWNAVASHLQHHGYLRKSKLIHQKAINEEIEHVVFVSRYKLYGLIVLDVGLAVRCRPLEEIFEAQFKKQLDKYFFTNGTSLVHLMNAFGRIRSQDDYSVTDPVSTAKLICMDFDDYADRFFEPQMDMRGVLSYMESEPLNAGGTVRRAAIAGLYFLTGQRDKAHKVVQDPSFGANNVFEKAVRAHIEESAG